jgi:two-component system chemotaxis response regulator CheY
MLSIMIVDDEELLIELYSKLLEVKGYRVVAYARDGQEAVDLFKVLDERPQLVLMDHRMPVKSGLEAMVEILEIEPSVQIVFLTADASVAERAIDAGAADVILKPFRMDVLHKTVDDVAGRLGD